MTAKRKKPHPGISTHKPFLAFMCRRVETTKPRESENPHHTSSKSEDVFEHTAQWRQKYRA
jgi:hypothetical protein